MNTPRTVRRAGTKTRIIPGAPSGAKGKLQEFGLGRYGRPNKMVLTKQNEKLWRK